MNVRDIIIVIIIIIIIIIITSSTVVAVICLLESCVSGHLAILSNSFNHEQQSEHLADTF
jgi:flagellar basal body-associated protein FliL